MYIRKISDFLSIYKNYEIKDFIQILEYSNAKKFDKSKYEKDFLLTLILIKFGQKYPDLVFKGGTCLNKIYFPYFRLSEDLDFVINKDIGRTARQTLLKKYEDDFVSDLNILGLKLRDERTKYDEHKLAMFTFEYNSILDNSLQTIKIDISLKNKLYLPTFSGEIKSNFKDTFLEENIFQSHFINCINLQEALAEKLRASLTRKEPAIRDFFDIWYVKNNSNFDFENEEFKKLLDIKLKETDYKYTLEENFENLKKQVQTDLKPVLNNDFSFDFEEIYDF
ncbi:MAG: nucleotidyl transferase AbiEii/AbiGii toxin family protein, partial [Candidatus Gracilibacteria bacterium]|nr:nucleotidyl transferase AbiEii/AbiGii toxin family protein [Candidatus Gracilibacteria bacterium]